MAEKIVFVHGSANMYGASRSLLRLVKHLPQPFIPVVVLPERGPLFDQLVHLNITVFIFPWLRFNILSRQAFYGANFLLFLFTFLPNLFRFSIFLKQRNITIVHTNNATVLIPAISSFLVRVPHIWHIRETLDEYIKLWSKFSNNEKSFFWKISAFVALRFWSFFVHFIYYVSAKVICVSEGVSRPFKSLGLNQKIEIIYNGLEIDYYLDTKFTQLDLTSYVNKPDEFFYIGTVGEIRAGKGQLFLIQAFEHFKKKYPDIKIKCLLVGGVKETNKQYYNELLQFTRTAMYGDDVIFLGQIPDPRPAFKKLDIFILPSVQAEPFGTVVLEAMVLKTPIIATNIGGTVEQVKNNLSGVLVEPSNIEELSIAIEKMVFDQVFREKLIENAYTRVKTFFNVENYVSNIAAVYFEILKISSLRKD